MNWATIYVHGKTVHPMDYAYISHFAVFYC